MDSKQKRMSGKTQIKTSKPLKEILEHHVWAGCVESFYGKDNCRLLNISTNKADTEYLIANKYNATEVSPNNIKEIEANNQYDLAIVTYLNKQMRDEFERENILYEINERIHRSGYMFLSLTKGSKIEIDGDIIIQNNSFTTYLI